MWDTSGSSPVQIPNPSVFSGDLRSGFAPTCTDYEAADYLKTLRFDVPFLVMLIGFIIIKTRSIAHLVYRFCGRTAAFRTYCRSYRTNSVHFDRICLHPRSPSGFPQCTVEFTRILDCDGRPERRTDERCAAPQVHACQEQPAHRRQCSVPFPSAATEDAARCDQWPSRDAPQM